MIQAMTLCLTDHCIEAFDAQVGMFQEHLLNTMGADVLAPCITRSSVAMMFTVWNRDVIAILESESLQTVIV